MQIITITPNPAIDISTSIGKIEPFTKMRCATARRDPGGGGINVARVINRLGGRVSAIYPAGGSTGDLLRQLLDREGILSVATRAAEETREDFTVFEESTSQQFRFVMPGGPLSECEWNACLKELTNFSPPPHFVVASGSLPPGVPEDFYSRVARAAKQKGARLVLDAAGAALQRALMEGVYLIKPNLREFCDLTGVRGSDEAGLIEAGRDLIAKEHVNIIALTLGPRGAMLIARDCVLRAEALSIKVASVVGAGDSFLGAIICSLARGDDLRTALSVGVAGGSAALLSPGTGLCELDDVRRLIPKVVVRPAGLGMQ
jgi:6-phosphofructokinase 2